MRLLPVETSLRVQFPNLSTEVVFFPLCHLITMLKSVYFFSSALFYLFFIFLTFILKESTYAAGTNDSREILVTPDGTVTFALTAVCIIFDKELKCTDRNELTKHDCI